VIGELTFLQVWLQSEMTPKWGHFFMGHVGPLLGYLWLVVFSNDIFWYMICPF